MKQFVSYAQNREDAILDAFFRDVKKGFYVDVGAHHPIRDSVTKSFYKKGWRGVNIEPNPYMYGLLSIDRPKDINVQAGISDSPGRLKLRIYTNSGLSTFSSTIMRLYNHQISTKTNEHRDITVPVTTLAGIFETNGLESEHIHFMKIDVEGFEYQVLKGNNWQLYRPEMICIEADHIIKNWRPLLKKNGYQLVWNDGLNEYYLADESLKRKNNFHYADDMLLNRQIIPYHVIDEIDKLQNEAEQQKVKNRLLNLKVGYLEDEITFKDQVIREQQRIRNTLKLFIKGIDRAIQVRIDSLLVPKATKRGHIRLEESRIEGQTQRKLLEMIRELDLENYYSTKPTKSHNVNLGKRFLHSATHKLYFVSRKPAVIVARKSGHKL